MKLKTELPLSWGALVALSLAAIATGVLLSFATRPGHNLKPRAPEFANGEVVELMRAPTLAPRYGTVVESTCTPYSCEYVIDVGAACCRPVYKGYELFPVRMQRNGPGR